MKRTLPKADLVIKRKEICKHDIARSSRSTHKGFLCLLDFCQECGIAISKWQHVSNDRNVQFCRSDKFEFPDKVLNNQNLVLNQMFRREKTLSKPANRPFFLNFRNELVFMIKEFCNMKKFKDITYSLTLRLLDEVCSFIDFKTSELPLIAMTCIILAAKLEENEYKIPSLAYLQEYLSNNFSFDQILIAEKTLFGLLKFNINRQTAVECSLIFLRAGVINSSDLVCIQSNKHLEFVQSFENLVIQLATFATENYEMNFYPMRILVSAIFCLSRNHFGLAEWSSELTVLTRTDLYEMNDCICNFNSILEQHELSIQDTSFLISKESAFTINIDMRSLNFDDTALVNEDCREMTNENTDETNLELEVSFSSRKRHSFLQALPSKVVSTLPENLAIVNRIIR
jgi:hypothetical protein